MNRYLSCAAIGLALCTVVACGTPSPGVAAKVDAAVVGLTTAEKLALIYTRLPSCETTAKGKLCSDPAVKQKIKDLDNTAYKAVKAAEKNEALLSAALDAVAALQSAIPNTVN